MDPLKFEDHSGSVIAPTSEASDAEQILGVLEGLGLRWTPWNKKNIPGL